MAVRLSEKTLNFGLLNIVETIETMGTFEVGQNGVLHYDMAISLWVRGVRYVSLKENDPQRVALLGVALL